MSHKNKVVGNHITQPAEVHGGIWERMSVFEHLERGLKKNPDALAVICLFQAENHLKNLGLEPQDTAEQYNAGSPGLWQKKRQQKHHDGWAHANLGRSDGHLNETVPNGCCDACGHAHGNSNAAERDDFLWRNNGERKHSEPGSMPGPLPNGTFKLGYLAVTYTQLHSIATHLAAGLLAHGAAANTKMVMLIPNGAEYTLLLYTCVLLRVTYTCLDPNLLDIAGLTMLKHHLRSLKPQIVVAPDAEAGRAVDVAVAELQLPRPVCVSLGGTTCRTAGTSGWRSLAHMAASGREALARGVVSEAALVDAARRDSAARIHSIMFTSGTSGLPKGCPVRAGGMSHALQSQEWLLRDTLCHADDDDDDDDDDAASAPGCPRPGSPARALMQPHNSRGIAPAQTLQTWRAGGAVVLTGQAFDAEQALWAVARARATFVVLTPPMVHEMAAALAARPGLDVGCVRTVQVGGDTVTRGLLEACGDMFPRARVLVNHGMTEGPGAFAWPRRFSRAGPAGRLPLYGGLVCPVGTVAAGAAVRVCDMGGGGVLARGELGEMHVSCPSIIGHYWNGRSDGSFYSDTAGRRWFRTGDAALVDNDGIVFVVGRVKDIIRRAGVPITPAPVESLIEGFTGAQTVVVPVPHHVLGAEPFAVVGSYNGKTDGDIKERVRAVFGRNYSLGGVVSLKQLGLDEFPLNATHKVIKSQVITAVESHVKSLSKS